MKQKKSLVETIDLDATPDETPRKYAADSALTDLINESNYYESNGEVICIDAD